MNIEENNSSSGNGDKGRFSERLKKIARDKKKKSGGTKKDVRIIFKPFLILSSFIYGSIKNDKKKQSDDKNVSLNKEILLNNGYEQKNDLNICNQEKDKQQKNINNSYDINYSSVSNNNYEYYNELIGISKIEGYDRKSLNITDDKIKKLQKDIVNSIKKRLVKTLNELEIAYSDFYVLKEINNEDIYLAECHDKIKEVKKLLSKIKSLKEKYDYLKDNIDFNDIFEIEDGKLVDQIIELKNICTTDEIKYTIDNYKILEEYKSLYLKIDKLEEEVEKYDKYKSEKEQELKERDIDFKKLKNEVYNKNLEKERYDSFVGEQERLMKKMEEELMNIDSREEVSYKINGFDRLIGNSFKYLGLIIASPLKGLFPGIATQLVATKNVIHNLYDNLEWEETKKTVYETIDFSREITAAINDLNHASILAESTLEDVRKLKAKYVNDFKKYQYNFSEYSEIIKKINKIENSVLNNKMKLDIMSKKMKVNKKSNEDKLEKVKKLNYSKNN